jgi:hypothetical protein
MTHPRALTPAVVAIGALLTVTLTTGITYAASASKGYLACANSKGDLGVLAKGKCAKGFKKVSVGAKGATGPRGAKGETGAKGDTGNIGLQGPGAISSVVSTTSTTTVQSPVATIGDDFQVQSSCAAGIGGSFAIAADAGTYTIDGTTNWHSQSLGPTAGYSYTNASGDQSGPISSGLNPISFTQITSTNGRLTDVEVSLDGTPNAEGDLWASLYLSNTTTQFTINLKIDVTNTTCLVNAQTIPSG